MIKVLCILTSLGDKHSLIKYSLSLVKHLVFALELVLAKHVNNVSSGLKGKIREQNKAISSLMPVTLYLHFSCCQIS